MGHMFCERCQLFCEGVESEQNPYTCVWPNYEMVLYDTFQELRSASKVQCCLCRSIWHCLDEKERQQLEGCSAILRMEADQGKPILRVRFEDEGNHSVRLTRTVAIYYGEIDSSKFAQT